MICFFLLLGFSGGILLLLTRSFFLAPTRAGWVFYGANLFWETLEKRIKRPRAWMEGLAALLSLFLLVVGGLSPWAILLVTVILGLFEALLRNRERNILTRVPLDLDEQGLRGAGDTADSIPRFPGPSVFPELTLALTGPFVSRSPAPTLGVLPGGQAFKLTLVTGNHTTAPTQVPVRVALHISGGWTTKETPSEAVSRIPAGGVLVSAWEIVPRTCPAGSFSIEVQDGRKTKHLRIAHGPCREIRAEELSAASITRYPGARKAAFAWRGDMDLYDSSSFQNISGLKSALELGRQYGIAQTMVTSTRLTLDEDAAGAWAKRYGVERDAGEIPAFAEWLKAEAHLCHRNPYPANTAGKPYALELGNHGHLHYDTDASGDPGNEWLHGVKPGEGKYAWSPSATDSFSEQRDNILEAQRWFRKMLDYTPRTWAKPGRGNDGETPRAVEASGIRVASGSDISAKDNVLRQPPPHHPAGTSIVELTARYPSDPRHVFHAWMQVFWMHRAWRKGIPMVYMCHQHMRQFEGHACTRITEFLLRRVLTQFHGDFYVDTLYGLGSYWLDVLNPETRKIHLRIENGTLFVENQSDEAYQDLPVDITLRSDTKPSRTMLVSVNAGETITIGL